MERHKNHSPTRDLPIPYRVISASSAQNSNFARKLMIQRWMRQWRSFPLTSAAVERIFALGHAGIAGEVSPLRLRDNGAPSAEQQRYCLAICFLRAGAEREPRRIVQGNGDTRYVCVRCSGKQWERPVRVSGSVRWTSVVKVSIIALALPYFSYGKLYRVVS